MKSTMCLLLFPLLAYSAVGNSMEDALNSKLLGTLISPQSSAEAAATMAHTSPLTSVASMAPMMMDYGMPFMSPYGYDSPMPYGPSVMPYMGAGASFSPFTSYMTPHPYSGMGFSGMGFPGMGFSGMGFPGMSSFPAYTSANPVRSNMPANQMAMPLASASTHGYF